jgi:8-oxo-dGTP pyrophosphatase MutT (NUDIX family)
MAVEREFHADRRDEPIKPASTVMLVRGRTESATPLEVFMVQRTHNASFARGMYVFPGGRVDESDADPRLYALCDGLDDERASALLRVERGGLAYWVGALRECFEESGILLARHARSGELVRVDDAATARRLADARHAVHDGTATLLDVCRAEGLRLSLGDVRYVSHWITPRGESRRFDTRFFVAPAPPGQEPLHDDLETIASLWVSPSEALERATRGELAMFPPTASNLQFLAGHADIGAVLAAADAVGSPTPILPKFKVDACGHVIGVVLPGEADYDSLPD